jgi:hypothetical protein
MVHWSGVMPCDRRSHQHMQSLQNVRKLNGMCVGVAFGACREPVAGQEGSVEMLAPCRSNASSPRIWSMCAAHTLCPRSGACRCVCKRAPRKHPVVALWPMASARLNKTFRARFRVHCRASACFFVFWRCQSDLETRSESGFNAYRSS